MASKFYQYKGRGCGTRIPTGLSGGAIIRTSPTEIKDEEDQEFVEDSASFKRGNIKIVNKPKKMKMVEVDDEDS